MVQVWGTNDPPPLGSPARPAGAAQHHGAPLVDVTAAPQVRRAQALVATRDPQLQSHTVTLQSYPATLQSRPVTLQSHTATLQSRPLTLQSHPAMPQPCQSFHWCLAPLPASTSTLPSTIAVPRREAPSGICGGAKEVGGCAVRQRGRGGGYQG